METKRNNTNQKCKCTVEYRVEIDPEKFLRVMLEVRGGVQYSLLINQKKRGMGRLRLPSVVSALVILSTDHSLPPTPLFDFEQ